MLTRWALSVPVLLVLGGCAVPLRVASDGGPYECRRVCAWYVPPVAQPSADLELKRLEDCCVDERGASWTSGAWNSAHRNGVIREE